MEQEKEANPIAEIFEEMFTLLEDLETRSVAVLEYLQEQGGVSEEKLTPYLDRAAAATDVRWRAARARMDHLLAPKPKSVSDLSKDEKSKGDPQLQTKPKEAESGALGSKEQQGENEQAAEPKSRVVGKELASVQSGSDKQAETADGESENTNAATAAQPKEKSEKRKSDTSNKSDANRSDGSKSGQPSDREMPQSQEAGK